MISYCQQFGGCVCGMTRPIKLGKQPFVQIKISKGHDTVKICYLEPLSHPTHPIKEWLLTSLYSPHFRACSRYQPCNYQHPPHSVQRYPGASCTMVVSLTKGRSVWASSTFLQPTLYKPSPLADLGLRRLSPHPPALHYT